MSKRVTLAALLVPAALLWSTGCKTNSSTPEQASQPPAQAAPAPSNAAPPSGSSAPSSSTAPSSSSSAAPASTAQPAPAASPAGTQPVSSPPANVATNAPTHVAAPPPPPPPPPPPIVVPAGTVLHVRLVQAVGSKISEEGSRFDATLSSSVVVKGVKVIPAGSKAVGTVTEAHAAGKFKGGATLSAELNSIQIGGHVYPIRTSQFSSESKGKGKRTAAVIGGGTGGGALIGGLAGGGKGALIGGLIGAGAGTVGAATTGNNRDITLQSESPLTFQLRSSLTLPPRAPKSSSTSAAEETAPPQP